MNTQHTRPEAAPWLSQEQLDANAGITAKPAHTPGRYKHEYADHLPETDPTEQAPPANPAHTPDQYDYEARLEIASDTIKSTTAERDRLREEVQHYRVALFNERESTSKALRKQGEQVKELLAACKAMADTIANSSYHNAPSLKLGESAIANVEGRSS